MDSSGGRVVAGSNPVTPTDERGKMLIIKPLFYFSTLFSIPIYRKRRLRQMLCYICKNNAKRIKVNIHFALSVCAKKTSCNFCSI